MMCIFSSKKVILKQFLKVNMAMKFLIKASSIIFCLMTTSCSRYYLSVDKQKSSAADIASRFTRSPDPDDNPALLKGEILEVSWHLPRAFENKAQCVLELTYWDYTQDTINFTIKDRLGRYSLENLGETFDKNKGIIAYKATLMDPNGKVYQTWEHQLFTNIIHVSEEEPDIKQDSIKLDDDPWDWESSL